MFKKVYTFFKNWPKFCRLAIIPFQKITKNPMKCLSLRQKSINFCTPDCDNPQPVLPYHQAESIPFANHRTNYGLPKYNFTTDVLYLGNAPEVAWKDITHSDYSDTDNPKPPHYRLYTGLNSKEFFIIFVVVWILQMFCIWLNNFLNSKMFKVGFI